QLAALADPASTLLNPERRKVSIIFTSQEAAKFDRETFYQIGLEGLNELIAISPDLFIPFRNSILFSDAYKQFERAVEDAAVNEQLDQTVDKFLITLSPYLMLKASLKCMEWLVYRFHIERFNVAAIIECIMPYYDTKHFVMIIQFGSARDPVTVEWEWLIPCIKSATVLRKATLYGNVNAPFVIWLFETLRKFLEYQFNNGLHIPLQIHQSHPDNLSTYLGFMVSTIVGIVTKFSREFSIKSQFRQIKSKKTVVDVLLSQIHALFEDILTKESFEGARNNREVYSVAYVIIATIGITAEENPEIGGILGSQIKRIFNLLIKNRNVALLEETYMLIDLLVHHIYFEWTFKRPIPFQKAMHDLSQISDKWDVSKVTTRLILANVSQRDILNPKMVFHWLSEIQLPPETRAEILSKAYFIYKEEGTRMGSKCAKNILMKFEKQYPSEFEMACKTDATFADDLANVKSGKNFLLLIDHPDANVRANAVRRLLVRATANPLKSRSGVSKKPAIKIQKTLVPDQNPTAIALIPKFTDESPLVIISLLKHKLSKLLKVFSIQTLLQGCISVAKTSKDVESVRLAVRKLCALAKKTSVNEQLEKQILRVLIPYLFPRKKAGLLTAKKIICSAFAMAESLDQITPEKFCCHSYKVLTTFNDGSLISDLSCASAVDLTIAFLLMGNESNLIGLLDTACTGIIQSSSDFPVTPANFSKCLLTAEKRNCVSLELILSSILKMEINTIANQLSVMKFVWSISENENNRMTTLKFCKMFLKKIYPDPTVQFWFWLTALRVSSTLEESKRVDFYVVRCLQFFTKFITEHGIPARLNSASETTSADEEMDTTNAEDPHRPLTRSQGKAEDVNLRSGKASSKLSKRHREQDASQDGVSPTWCLLEILFSKCIQHPSQIIRRLCVKFFEVIRKVPKLSVDWEELLAKVLAYKKEIVADSSQAPVLIGRVIVDAKLMSVRSQIVKALKSETVDQEVFIGLVNICQHTGSMIYGELEPMIKKLLDTDIESQQLQALLNCFEASPKSIEILPKLLQSKACTKTVLRKFNSRLFSSESPGFRKQLFGLMIDSAVDCKVPEIKLAIQRCVQKWEVESSLISEEIKKCMSAERRNVSAFAASRKEQKEHSGKGEDVSDWKGRTEVVLEFVQGMKKLTEKKLLLAPLFRVLKLCISLEEQSPVEYLKQLTLTALTLCCEEDSDDQGDSGTFHVELVIDCLRCSRNPQTHHHALILLNYASKRFQEQVLHGVMSLFTFMGNSILRQDDTYSTQLIQQTVTTIIPALTKAGKGGHPQFSRTVVSGGIFRVFASALQDIPVHRRLPVFTSLVETLDPEECLWQVLIIIVDNALNRDRKRSNLNADLELATDLAWSCEPATVLCSLAKVYDFFNAMSEVYQTSVSEDGFRNLKNGQSPVTKAVFDFSRKENYRDIQLVIHYTLELLLKIASKFADLADVKLEYDTVIERCLSFSRIVSGLAEEKIFRLIAHKNFEVMEKINAVLEVEDFVRVVSGILERNDFAIKRKILDMLNLRLTQKIEWFGDLNILLGLLNPLLKVASLDPASEEVVTLVQTAFLALKLIAKHLAFSHPEEFVSVFNLALSCVAHENHLLCASALLCMGELFCLKSLLLPKLNVVTSGILRALKTSSKLHGVSLDYQTNSEENGVDSNENNAEEEAQVRQDLDNSLTSAHLLCISTIACMNKMAEQLGTFMGSKFLKKALIYILKIDSQISLGDIGGTRKKTFDQRLRVLLKTIATKVPVRNTLIPLKGTFHSLIDKPRATKAIMFALKESLQATSKPDFGLILPSLCDSFVEEFLVCRDHVNNKSQDLSGLDDVKISEKNQDIIAVEDSVIDCLISGAVLKMSEGTFRPFYHKLFDWARDSDPRLITFYRFSASAAERLKSLFVTFAGNVMNEAVNCLNRNVELTKGVLSLFYHLFCNDREGFVTTDRFNAVVKPLVDLLESDFILNGHIELKILSDTLIQLAVSSNDLNRWQHMIDLISSKTHSSNKKVRLNVVATLESAATELGKDFLPLLPPVVPFLAELMNDDEPEVESATHKMLLKLETIVGEPLQPYFT
ncbi:HEAT repeat-containing protein 1, partial [Orchesella cincta]